MNITSNNTSTKYAFLKRELPPGEKQQRRLITDIDSFISNRILTYPLSYVEYTLSLLIHDKFAFLSKDLPKLINALEKVAKDSRNTIAQRFAARAYEDFTELLMKQNSISGEVQEPLAKSIAA